MNQKEKEDYLKSHWLDSTNEEIGKVIGLAGGSIRRLAKRLGLPAKNGGGHNKKEAEEVDPEQQVSVDGQKHSFTSAKKVIDKKYRAAIQQIADLQEQIEIIYQTKDKIEPPVYTYKPLNKDCDSVAVVLASDWHIEEQVKLEWTNGMSEYSTEIAAKCAEQFFQNTVKLLHKEAKETNIETLVLALLGDFITNYLHDENVETCTLAPADAILLAQDLLIAGIEYILKHTKVNLIIPCHVGNHSRTTDKVHFSTEAGNSWESVIYRNMQLYFSKEKRVTFLISKAYVSYVDLGGYVIAFHHGHGFRFGGAIGGITTAVVKWRDKIEQARKADLYCFGHHHTQFDGRLFLANGSMIGYGARAQALGYAYEPRSQTFFLVNMKHKRKTVVVPILFTV